jgi:hypothetical protein
MDALEQAGIIMAMIVGVFAIAYYISSIRKTVSAKNAPLQPKFILQRFQESVKKPIPSEWSIRILHPDKPIEKCRVLLGGKPLPWWNSNEPSFEQTIVAYGGGNVRVPIDWEKVGAEVKIMDGENTLRIVKFGEITKANA